MESLSNINITDHKLGLDDKNYYLWTRVTANPLKDLAAVVQDLGSIPSSDVATGWLITAHNSSTSGAQTYMPTNNHTPKTNNFFKKVYFLAPKPKECRWLHNTKTIWKFPLYIGVAKGEAELVTPTREHFNKADFFIVQLCVAPISEKGTIKCLVLNSVVNSNFLASVKRFQERKDFIERIEIQYYALQCCGPTHPPDCRKTAVHIRSYLNKILRTVLTP